MRVGLAGRALHERGGLFRREIVWDPLDLSSALNRLTGDFRNLLAKYASDVCRSARLNQAVSPARSCVNRG